MKKILHFHPNAFYAKKFVRPLIDAEQKEGYYSKLVTEISNGQSDFVTMFSLTLNPVALTFRIVKLLILLKKNKPDIIFAHNSISAFLPLLASRLLYIKKIVYFNHGLPFVGYVGPLRFLLENLEKINCILAYQVITVSEDMRYKLINLTKKNVCIIHNGSASGLDAKIKLNTNSIEKLKKRINFNTNNKIVLFVGRPNKRKGFFDIMEIWDKDFKNKRNFKLILLGINYKDVSKITKRVPENIFPMGLVDDTVPFYDLADYLFMTSHHEGLSYSVLESFLYRTFVISNKIDGVSELVKHNYNGYLVEKNNKYDYFNLLNYCENNKKTKKIMLDRSFKITSKYDRIYFLKSYIKFLKQSFK